jgi:XRE family aerobic/anaerobic benzoate catabolism transcriptional regulator
MAASREAMEDLKGILAGRAAFYSKAEFRLDTSAAAAGSPPSRRCADGAQALQLPT